MRFPVVADFEQILFTPEQRLELSQPSDLTNAHLCSNWNKQSYRTVDFTNTSVEEAIRKILTFYKHKTYRRLIGQRIFFNGIEDDIVLLSE
jgi:hypothetical protein